MSIFDTHDFKGNMSSTQCKICGAEASGFKCPKCGKEIDRFDPFHFKECAYKTKLQTKCKACGQAEMNCTCKPPQLIKLK